MRISKAILRAVALGAIATVLVGLAGLVASPGTAQADGVSAHNPAGGDLNAPCAGCHRIHTAQNANLLQQNNVNNLCRTCHGASGTGSDLNVDLGKTNAAGLALRAGGFQQTLINTADPSGAYGLPSGTSATIGVLAAPGNATTSMHNIGDTALTIWGNAAGGGFGAALATFNCANCHDPHGGADHGAATYRILRPVPVGSGATASATVGGNGVVTDEGAGPRHYNLTDYYQPRGGLTAPAASTTSGNQSYPILNTTASGGISGWCAQCHTAYFQADFPKDDAAGNQLPNGTVGSYAGNFMHKAGDISVNSTTGAITATSITCTKCHVGHGTSATMSAALWTSSVTDPGSTSLSAASGASRLLKMNDRGICRKCHRDK